MVTYCSDQVASSLHCVPPLEFERVGADIVRLSIVVVFDVVAAGGDDGNSTHKRMMLGAIDERI